MSKDRIEEFLPRNEGCHATLKDDGDRQVIPVCMGGTELPGCNNADECLATGRGDAPSGYANCIFRDKEDPQIIKGITTVMRGSILSTDIVQS